MTKRILFSIFCLAIFSLNATAQASDAFDIATFQPPSGWKKQVKEGAVIFNTSDPKTGTYAMIVLYGSAESTGSAKSDFNSEWQRFIAQQLGVTDPPQMEPVKGLDGWQVVTGGTAFKDGQATSAVILQSFSGFGTVFSMSAVFNSREYMPAIDTFSSSVKLSKPAAGPQPSVASDSSASVIGTWGISASDQSSFAVNNAVSDYIVRQYTLNGDGTYIFLSKTFSPFSDKLLLGKENGTYQISGNNITISPKKSVLEAWSKKDGTDRWGRLLSSQNRALETVTYQFTKHYFSGIKVWSLVFQASRVTQRDGPYSGGNAFTNAWIYSPPCSQCFIELPR
jgi:starvation-inducible outer membrane lipoprotein